MAEIVLVHGAWHGPWCWDDVTGALRSRGHDVFTVTLPGHETPGRQTRIWNRMGQYIDAVGRAAAAMERPVLVGHSMGGYTVQRHLERHRAARGVLVASVPVTGALGANLRILRSHPGLTLRSSLTCDYYRLVDEPELVRELFFTPETPDEIIHSLAPRLQNESALAINTMVLRRPRPKQVAATGTPVSVIAARDDAIFTLDEQRTTAAAYGTDTVELDGGHDLMLDTTWPALVDAIEATLD